MKPALIQPLLPWTFQDSLTRTKHGSILAALSPHVTAGIETPRTGRYTRPLSSVVFLCPPKRSAQLCADLIVMVGCIEQLLIELAGACTGSLNLIHSATQHLRLVAGGTPFFTGLPA